jgi:16S rRNA pseudouridine516 synthase
MSSPRKPRRLDQILASLGYGSRSNVKDAIRDGRVRVDGVEADDPGLKTTPDRILWDGAPLDHPDGIFIRFHKPVGLVCSHDPREGPRIYDVLPPRWLDRNPVPTSIGRLDKDSSGLLLITDRTELVHLLTSPKHKVPKVYQVVLDKPAKPDLVHAFASGTLLLEGEKQPCAPATLEVAMDCTCTVTLTEGRFRQVRRMFAHFGFEVRSLHRTRFGPWSLDALPEGSWEDATYDLPL